MVRLEEELKITHEKINLRHNQYNILGFGNVYIPKEEVHIWTNTDQIFKYVQDKVNIKPSELEFINIFKQCSVTKQWYSLNNFKLEKSKKIRKKRRELYYTL